MKTSSTRRILRVFTPDNNLLWISLFAFLIIYLSSFVKGYGYFIDEPSV